MKTSYYAPVIDSKDSQIKILCFDDSLNRLIAESTKKYADGNITLIAKRKKGVYKIVPKKDLSYLKFIAKKMVKLILNMSNN